MSKIFNVIIFISIILLSIIIFVREKDHQFLEHYFNDFKGDIEEAVKEMKYDLIDLKARNMSSNDEGSK